MSNKFLHPDVVEASEFEIKRRALEILAKQNTEAELKAHLDKQCARGWLLRDEFRLWEDAMFPPHGIKAAPDRGIALLEQAWDGYRTAIARYGNPDDQIENFHRAGIILQDPQLEFAAWARQADEPQNVNEIGMGGARGGAKSFVLFTQATVDDCQRFAGLNVLYLRKAHNKGQEQMAGLIAAVLPRIPHNYRERMSPQLVFPNGSAVRVGHYRNETEALNYQGLEYDVVVIEEATHLSLDAYKTLRNSTRSSKGWRPRVYTSTNPLGKGHLWFKKRFVDPEKKNIPAHEREHKTRFIFATVDNNNHVDEEYKDNLRDLTGAKRAAFLEGNWDVSAGAYFSTWDSGSHLVENINEFDDSWSLWTAKDYGWSHWDIWYLLGQQGENYYLLYELANRHTGIDAIAQQYFTMLEKLGIKRNRIRFNLCGNDAFRMSGHTEMTVAQKYLTHGIELIPADTAPGSRIGGGHHMLMLLGDPKNAERPIPARFFVCARCERFLQTFPYLEHDPNNPEDVLKVNCDEDGEGGDDPYDAARYGLYIPHATGMASGRS